MGIAIIAHQRLIRWDEDDEDATNELTALFPNSASSDVRHETGGDEEEESRQLDDLSPFSDEKVGSDSLVVSSDEEDEEGEYEEEEIVAEPTAAGAGSPADE